MQYLGQVATGDDGGGLVVDATLETSGAPVHELDGPAQYGRVKHFPRLWGLGEHR